MPCWQRSWWSGSPPPALAQKPVKIGVLTPLSARRRGCRPVHRPRRQDGRGGSRTRAAASSAGGRSSWSSRTTPARRRRARPAFASSRLRTRRSRSSDQFHSSVMTAVQVARRAVQGPGLLTQASARQITEKHLNYTFRTHVIDPDRCADVDALGQGARLQARRADHGRTPTTAWAWSTRPRRRSPRCTPGAGAQDDHLRPRGGRSHAAAPRRSRTGSRTCCSTAAIGTPTYLITKQACDVGLTSGGAHAHLLRRAVAAGVLEDPRREGQLRLVHRLLPPDHDA